MPEPPRFGVMDRVFRMGKHKKKGKRGDPLAFDTDNQPWMYDPAYAHLSGSKVGQAYLQNGEFNTGLVRRGSSLDHGESHGGGNTTFRSSFARASLIHSDGSGRGGVGPHVSFNSHGSQVSGSVNYPSAGRTMVSSLGGRTRASRGNYAPSVDGQTVRGGHLRDNSAPTMYPTRWGTQASRHGSDIARNRRESRFGGALSRVSEGDERSHRSRGRVFGSRRRM